MVRENSSQSGQSFEPESASLNCERKQASEQASKQANERTNKQYTLLPTPEAFVDEN